MSLYNTYIPIRNEKCFFFVSNVLLKVMTKSISTLA